MLTDIPLLGLVLTGGGARAAYQVGVLKGVSELVRRGSSCPFSVITGTSAGAVSAIALASDAAHFRRSVYAIESVWRDFRVHQVFKADASSMLRSGLHWLSVLITGGWLVKPPSALFDNTPLRDLLRAKLNFDGIPRGLYKKHLEAIGICATSYTEGDSVTFYAGDAAIDPWRRASRKGMRVQLTLDHLMASLAIPFLFSPIRLQDAYFGDGAMRQTSPLSPAIHLGANRLLIVGVGDANLAGLGSTAAMRQPTFGQMFGFMMDSLFIDQLHSDLERINGHHLDRDARRIDSLLITPSQDLSAIARRHRHELPRSLRTLLRTFGANNPAGTQLLSYILFERGFTRELIALGLADTRARGEEIRSFLALEHRHPHRASQAVPV